MNFKDDERCRLLHKSALHFGYYDGKLELTAGNSLEAFKLIMLYWWCRLTE